MLIRDDSMLPSFSFSANFFLRLIYLGSWLLSICFLFSFSASWISFLLVSGMHWVISWVYIRQPVFFQPRDLGRVFGLDIGKMGFNLLLVYLLDACIVIVSTTWALDGFLVK